MNVATGTVKDVPVTWGEIDTGVAEMVSGTAVIDTSSRAGPCMTSPTVASSNSIRVVDEVAYLRFASVYKGFEGVDDFRREVGLLTKTTAPKQPEA